MCGRYDLNQSLPILMLYFSLARAPEEFSNAEVRPTDWASIKANAWPCWLLGD